MPTDLGGLEEALGYRFSDKSLLRRALTHRSYSGSNNERLEFLGDSILNAAVAKLLYDRFGDHAEGDLSRLRALLVRQDTLASVASELNLGAFLDLGDGELRSGGAQRPSILADALEAVFGAVFLETGFDGASAAIARALNARLLEIPAPGQESKDSKTRLQEWLQARRQPLPKYTLLEQIGEAHDRRFMVECSLTNLGLRGCGDGASRRSAEQSAAAAVLAMLPKTESRAQ